MNNLKNLQKIINNCSRCGLCQAVCPIFEQTKNDCASPKGIIIMLQQLIKTNKKPSQKLHKYIKMCTKCQKCYKYCPSKINITEIIQNYEKDFPSKISMFLNNIENLFFKIKKTEIIPEIYKNKKVIYIKSQKEILPKNIQSSDFIIIDDFNFSLDYIFHNPKLTSSSMENIIKKIIELNPDKIITRCPLIKIQLQIKLFQKKSPIKVNF